MSDAPAATPSSAPVSEGSADASTEAPASDVVESNKTPPKQKAPTYRKIKVGNEEVSLSDEDIARDLQKWRGADAKFREASEAKKSVEQFMKKLQEDPEAVLNDPRLPIDRKKLAEKWLVKQLEAELNPPDPRDEKLSAAEKKLKEYQDRENEEKETVAKAEESKAREARKTAISNTLSEAMKATQLSAHPESAASVLREMAMYMRAAAERGDSVTPQELVEHVHNTRFNQLYTLAHQFEGGELIEFLGEEIVQRIRKADLARLRAGRDTGNSHRAEVNQDSRPRDRNAPRMDAIAARAHAKKLLG